MSRKADHQNMPPPYAVLELRDVSPILQQPLASTGRIKYTCFDVSRNLIALGASSGGIYVFSRMPAEFLQLIPNKEGAIICLAISSDEKNISSSNGKGVVSVVECQNSSAQHTSLVSREHQGNEVTAMVWSSSSALLYVGDDVGRVSILQIPTFITKTMFHSAAQVIMNLDSRICQLDIENSMLLVSTLTRCYISDTEKELYRQIGQKPRDGEYGACFLTCAEHEHHKHHAKARSQSTETSEIKKYQAMTPDENFKVDDRLDKMKIFCARPGSRLWEADVDGTVKQTHQYKHVLARPPGHIVTQTSYNNENVARKNNSETTETQSLNFAKLHALRNCVIFTHKSDAIYFLDTQNVEQTMWFDAYKDIVDARVCQNHIYLWRSNGSMTTLLFLTIEQYLLKCYIDEKYSLCGELCSLYRAFLINSENISPNLHILSGLREKLKDTGSLLEEITPVLDRFSDLKASQSESGIIVVDNTYRALSFLDENGCQQYPDSKFLPPEAMQALKDFGNTVANRLNSSKRKLRETWEDIEEKMKSISIEKPQQTADVQHLGSSKDTKERIHVRIPPEPDEYHIEAKAEVVQDILHHSSHKKSVQSVKLENNLDNNIFKSLYKSYKLVQMNAAEISNMCHILDECSCDIKEVYRILEEFQQYCQSIDVPPDESVLIAHSIFLTYIDSNERRDELIDIIIQDATLYQTFVDAIVEINVKHCRISHQACECGFPLPYGDNQTPLYSELIDRLIEKQWSSHSQNCYEMCKKMPYLWRKILFLRRNEDLLNILLILLQILDETLLYSFLPQFTIATWDRTIQLYSILSTNVCLNCRKRFENVNAKETLSWDALGLLLIKSVGGREAVEVMGRHADLMSVGDLSLKFYHTCLLVTKYEKIDGTVRNQLADTVYAAYHFEDAKSEILKVLRALNNDIRNTSLPLAVAEKSQHWGAQEVLIQNSETDVKDIVTDVKTDPESRLASKNARVKEMVAKFADAASDCVLCGLPMLNEVLVRDGGLWVFKCGHLFHGACLDLLKVKLCPSCVADTPR